MTIEVFREMFERDLRTLRGEIEAYRKDEDLWALSDGIANSAGTLTLHLAGNLQHYIGAHLGKSGYRRDRDAEFARRGAPRAELLDEIAAAAAAVSDALGRLTDANLQDEYPEDYRGEKSTVAFMLPHILGHLNYHLGQINYHRRLLSNPGAR